MEGKNVFDDPIIQGNRQERNSVCKRKAMLISVHFFAVSYLTRIEGSCRIQFVAYEAVTGV